jgi:hypothetical protein
MHVKQIPTQGEMSICCGAETARRNTQVLAEQIHPQAGYYSRTAAVISSATKAIGKIGECVAPELSGGLPTAGGVPVV